MTPVETRVQEGPQSKLKLLHERTISLAKNALHQRGWKFAAETEHRKLNAHHHAQP